jgi:putative adhesin
MLPMTIGRRVALAIGVPLCLVLTANTGYELVADVGRGKVPVDYRIPPAARRLSVTTPGGTILLRQIAGGQGSIAGTGTYSLVRPHITERLTGSELAFGYGCVVPEGFCGWDGTVSVDGGTAVSVSTGGGDITADGTSGTVSLTTGGGNVTADRVSGDLAMSTGGGNIQAADITAAQVSADTGGGDVEIVFTQVPRNVEVSTGGGDITIVVPPGSTQYHVISSTGGGNVNDEVPGNRLSPRVISATSGGGDITIREGTSP